jgi:nucleotide-binding universal stress UspA family protein
MTLNLRTIAFPVDFSHRCRLAAPYVQSAAARYGATVLAIHAVDPVDQMTHVLEPTETASGEIRARWHAQAKARLETFVERELPGLKPGQVEQIVTEGAAGPQVVEIAHRRQADWIMMPTHGFSALRRFVLGSVTARVLQEARCPVWTAAIEEDGQDEAPREFRHVLAAVAFDDHAGETISYAGSLAAGAKAELTIVHATPAISGAALDWAGGSFNDKIVEQASHSLGLLREKLGLKARIVVRCGDVERVVRDVATELGAGLVVIARGAVTEGAGRLRAHSYGIVNEAPCPVLSV